MTLRYKQYSYQLIKNPESSQVGKLKASIQAFRNQKKYQQQKKNLLNSKLKLFQKVNSTMNIEISRKKCLLKNAQQVRSIYQIKNKNKQWINELRKKQLQQLKQRTTRIKTINNTKKQIAKHNLLSLKKQLSDSVKKQLIMLKNQQNIKTNKMMFINRNKVQAIEQQKVKANRNVKRFYTQRSHNIMTKYHHLIHQELNKTFRQQQQMTKLQKKFQQLRKALDWKRKSIQILDESISIIKCQNSPKTLQKSNSMSSTNVLNAIFATGINEQYKTYKFNKPNDLLDRINNQFK